LDIFLVVWLIGILTIWPIWFGISISGRRKRGEPLIPKPPATAQFSERRASGNQEGHPLAHARKCLQVCVADGVLWVTPTFPFNLLAPYGMMGLEHRVALVNIHDVEIRRDVFGGKSVQLRIAPDGQAHAKVLNLLLKAPDAFVAALAKR
jgi:hypothetical protein